MPHNMGLQDDPELLILTSLADGPKHGYAMIQDIERLSGKKLGPGTLYVAIARLEKRGYIEPLPTSDRRRPYRITRAGAAWLRQEMAGARDVATAALNRLGTA